MPSNRIMTYALYGGIITGATIGLPVLDFLNCLCCAGVILGGFLSVFLAVKDMDAASPGISQSDALQLGVFSGLFGAVIGTVFHALVLLIAGNFMIDMIASFLREGDLEHSLPPGMMDELWEMLNTQEGFSIIDIFFHLFIWLILGPLFGLLGGLLGYSLLRRPKSPLTQPLSPDPL